MPEVVSEDNYPPDLAAVLAVWHALLDAVRAGVLPWFGRSSGSYVSSRHRDMCGARVRRNTTEVLCSQRIASTEPNRLSGRDCGSVETPAFRSTSHMFELEKLRGDGERAIDVQTRKGRSVRHSQGLDIDERQLRSYP
jgi:hypothetical protein